MLELTTSILFPSKMLKRDSSFINKLQRFTNVRDELGYERETFCYIVIQRDEIEVTYSIWRASRPCKLASDTDFKWL